MQGKCECSRSVIGIKLNVAGQSCVNGKTLKCNRNNVFEEQFNDSVNEVEKVAQHSSISETN